MAQIIDGKALAERMHEDLRAQIVAEQLSPGLAVILVGENPASQVYVRNKGLTAEKIGIRSTTHCLPETTTQAELLAVIDRLNRDEKIHGILVQAPLPSAINAHTIFSTVSPDKDVDGFNPINVGRLSIGEPCLVPCTPQGSMILLHHVLKDLAGKHALVIGRSNIVGIPMAQLLLKAHCTVTIAHSRTKDLITECRRADIVVAAIGRPEFVKGNWIKPGAIVIDVGINRIDNPANPGKTKLVGDVEFVAAQEFAAAITPVPGGVGPMTIACLMRNTVQSAKAKQLLPAPH